MPDPDVQLIVAPNPGPMTLEGTNTYLVGRDPAIVIDPGPEDREHIQAVRKAGEERGGIEAVLVTHSHEDHLGGVELLGIEPARPADGEVVGGLKTLATPGHTEDHLCFLTGTTLFCGDLILGEGSTIVPPADQGGSLTNYMASLNRVSQLDLELLYPGHGPMIEDPAAKIAEYIEHRESRERRLLAALERGERSRMALLKEVWDDVPDELLPAAAYAMQAHLEKLEAEGRLPDGLSE
jgi:glyoxylase-like metal-dependent hydrolase (beta-lactamase superfamily II)